MNALDLRLVQQFGKSCISSDICKIVCNLDHGNLKRTVIWN